MKETRFEDVEWDIKSIVEVNAVFAKTFAEYSDVFAAGYWIDAVIDLARQLESQKPTELTLSSEGIQVSMSAFQKPQARQEKDAIIYSSPEPRISVVDRLKLVSSKNRTGIDRITEEVFLGMQEHFDLEIEDPPPTLVLPKEKFSKNIRVFDATVLHQPLSS